MTSESTITGHLWSYKTGNMWTVWQKNYFTIMKDGICLKIWCIKSLVMSSLAFLITVYALANEVAKGYSNATVRPSLRNILVNTLESTSFMDFDQTWYILSPSENLEPYWFSRSLGQIFRRGDMPRFALPFTTKSNSEQTSFCARYSEHSEHRLNRFWTLLKILNILNMDWTESEHYWTFWIRVITKLPNSEQSYKGKVKAHKYINRQNQSTTWKLWKP